MLVTAVLFLQLAPFALALELNYPTLNFPGAPSITNTTSLIQYVQYFFMFVILVTGIIAVVTIVIDGAKILLYSAGGNTDAIGEARKNIFGSVLGIILLLFSFVILRTINPELVQLQGIGEAPTEGVVYYYFTYQGVDRYLRTPDSEDDMIMATRIQSEEFWSFYSTAVSNENAKLYLTYKCSAPGVNVLAWLYSEKNKNIDLVKNNTANNGPVPLDNSYYNDQATPEAPNVKTTRLLCSGINPNNQNSVLLLDPVQNLDTENVVSWSFNVRSWQWFYEEPGVSFYSTKNCTGISSVATRGSASRFSNPPLSVRITNGLTQRDIYGVYLRKGNQNESSCIDEPIINPIQTANIAVPSTKCYAMLPENFAPTDAYVFNYRTNIPASNQTAIRLNSSSNFINLSIDFLKTYNAPVANPLYYKRTGDSWPSTLITTDAQCIANRNCIRTLTFNLRKSYIMVLRSKEQNGERDICRFYDDNSFLPLFDDIYDGNRKLYRMDVIPVYQHSVF